MKTHHLNEIKIISKVCEEAEGVSVANSPAKIRHLWETCVATAPWFDPDKEAVVVFNLNTKLRVKSWQMVAVGTINETSVTPREILRPAVATLAHSVIFAHNHPSGDTHPSPADMDITRRVRDGAKTLNIVLQDHIIIGRKDENGNQNAYYSFREAGYL